MAPELWTSFSVAAGWTIHAAASEEGITKIRIEGEAGSPRNDAHPLLTRARTQLAEYFRGERRSFDLPVDLKGTPFELTVWRALEQIPYGETISYAELARRCGSPQAFRAVGRANGKNPIAIVVPCHRVITSRGTLGGYRAGVAYKRWLLELEARTAKASSSSSRSTVNPIFSQYTLAGLTS